QDVTGIFWRRGWLIVFPFALGLATAPMIVKRMPKEYRSETLMTVVPQRVPDTYVKSTVTDKMEERLPSISSVILSRSRLERTILDFNLYPTQRRQQPMDEVVEHMRDDITVKLEGTDSFRVSYESSDPQIAQKVTARL